METQTQDAGCQSSDTQREIEATHDGSTLLFVSSSETESIGYEKTTEVSSPERQLNEAIRFTDEQDRTSAMKEHNYTEKISIAVQANDYEIERRSGKLPARKRVIPKKFWDYRDPERWDNEDNSDEDYDPEVEAKTIRRSNGGKRGRPRKNNSVTEGHQVAPDAPIQQPVSRPKKSGGIQHLKRGRPSKDSGLLLEKIYPCDECDKKFSQKGNLRAHMLIHKNERPYKCDMEGCTKEYRSNSMLKIHKASHFGIKMYPCPECGRKLATSVSLKEHLLIHQDIRPHSCHICERKFRQLSALTKHIVTHSSATPFTCNDCGKKFSQQTYLKSHQRIHTGEKPFSCTLCDKSFAHGSDLVRHQTVHTREKPYMCESCGTKFSDPSSRRRHMKEHVGIKPYSCQLCGETFKRAGQLKVHLNRKHSHLGEDVQITNGDQNTLQFSLKGGSQLVTIRRALDQAPARVDMKALELQKKIVKQLQKPGQVYHLVQAANQVSGDQQSVVNTMLQLSQTTGQQPSVQDGYIVTETSQQLGQQLVAHEEVLGETSAGNSSKDLSESEQPVDGVAVDSEASANYGTVEMAVQPQRTEQPVEIEYHIIEYDASTNEMPSNEMVQELVKQAASEAVGSQEEPGLEQQTPIKPQDTAPPGVDYIANPDFNSQDYYNWLSNFSELCKLVPMPLDVDLFTKISQVQKTLADILASPTGVLTKRENFRILMGISKDLNTIANEHLAFILQNLDSTINTEESI